MTYLLRHENKYGRRGMWFLFSLFIAPNVLAIYFLQYTRTACLQPALNFWKSKSEIFYTNDPKTSFFREAPAWFFYILKKIFENYSIILLCFIGHCFLQNTHVLRNFLYGVQLESLLFYDSKNWTLFFFNLQMLFQFQITSNNTLEVNLPSVESDLVAWVLKIFDNKEGTA